MRAGGWGNLWPYHPKPRPDELLSSWIVRTAAGNGLKLHTFTSLVWPQRQVWNRDIDNLAPEAILADMARHTGTPLALALRTSLASLEGTVFEQHQPNGHTPWIMPLGIYHRLRKRFGQQFCAECLAEEPYYRRIWRLAFATVCIEHKLMLHDRCPRCGIPVHFHRRDLGNRAALDARLLTACYACDNDLRSAQASEASEDSVDFMRRLVAILAGDVAVVGNQSVFPNLYFGGLRILLALLTTGGVAGPLRAHLSAELAIADFEPAFESRLQLIEFLPAAQRAGAMRMAAALLEDWPARFIETSLRLGFTASSLGKHLPSAPFWYWDVVRAHFDRSTYSPSVEEIEAGIQHLMSSTGRALKSDVKALFGGRDILRKRSLSRLLPPPRT